MKKLSKLKLHDAKIMNDGELKSVVGGGYDGHHAGSCRDAGTSHALCNSYQFSGTCIVYEPVYDEELHQIVYQNQNGFCDIKGGYCMCVTG